MKTPSYEKTIDILELTSKFCERAGIKKLEDLLGKTVHIFLDDGKRIVRSYTSIASVLLAIDEESQNIEILFADSHLKWPNQIHYLLVKDDLKLEWKYAESTVLSKDYVGARTKTENNIETLETKSIKLYFDQVHSI